jgi:hypothetical protein
MFYHSYCYTQKFYAPSVRGLNHDEPGAAGRDDAKTPACVDTQAGFVWTEPMNRYDAGPLGASDSDCRTDTEAYQKVSPPSVKNPPVLLGESKSDGGQYAAL